MLLIFYIDSMKKGFLWAGTILVAGVLLVGAGCSGNTGIENTGASVDDTSQGPAGTYETYDESKLALAETGNVVLFFKADWCSSCRALEKNILKNKQLIPEDLAILTLNYDIEIALRKKYGVTTQHTLVEVDSQGNMIGKWIGSPTLNDVVARLK